SKITYFYKPIKGFRGTRISSTMPKRNADFRAKPKGMCIFIVSLNLWDLALDKKKIKQNQKL
ncbi:hypothetical protein ACFQZJ_00030, partial [Maribacter chungangensis]